MKPVSPTVAAGSLVTFTIRVEGETLAQLAKKEKLSDTFQVVSIDTWVALNKVPKARLVLFDGSAAKSDFPVSNLDVFLPGNAVEIAAGYDSKEKTLFRGVIARQGIEIDQTRGSQLVVDLTDEAIKMTLARKNALFEKIKDSELIGKLITDNKLAKDVAPTNTVHEEIVQYYATDWDLMLTRAEMNGFVVSVEAGKVTVGKPDTGSDPDLVVKYGDSILDLDAEMNAATQYSDSAIKSFTWDVASQKLIDAGAGKLRVTTPGDVTSDELAKVFAVKQLTQQTGGPIEKSSLADWSSAELLKSRLSKIRGSVRFQGSALARLGTTLELAGLGRRFNGRAYISGVHHQILGGKWLTTAQFGLSSRWFAAEAPDIAAPDASGQLPPIKGLQTGVVKKVAKDPEGEYRVLVNLPLLQAGSQGVWARLGTFYASSRVGAVFYPEIDDEVIVAFMNQDPRYPVIVGSVYSKKLTPPYPPDEKNTKKALVTRSKLELTFDDADKIVEIKTPAGQSVRLDDKAGEVKLADKNNNTVTLSEDGIKLASASNVAITARGDVQIQARGDLMMTANGGALLEALRVEHKAKTKFSAKSNLQAEVVATGPLTLRGAMVKIN